MDTVKQQIHRIIEETVTENGLFLIELIIRGSDKKRVIEAYIDSETNLTAETCAAVSRQIDSKLEMVEEIGSDYRLDVSSPGTDRPLKYLKQYPKNINRKFDISYTSESGTKKLTGILTAIDGEELTFLVNKQPVVINFNNIKKAKVTISFS